MKGGVTVRLKWNRPSPAFVVACLALFVALGSTAYAVTQVNGHDIINGTIIGNKLAKNTLKGREVLESKLGVVPSARNALTVGHMTVRKVAISKPFPGSGTTNTLLFNLVGLRLVHGCPSNGDNSLTATASKIGILKVETFDEGSPATPPFFFEAFNLRPSDGPQNLLVGISDSANVMGRLIWQTASGKALTFEFQIETNAFGGPSDCTLGGTLVAG